MNIMNIVDATKKIPQMSEDVVLFAKVPRSCGAQALSRTLNADGSVPKDVKAAGFEYLLERDEIMPLLTYVQIERVSDDTVAECVVYYAMFDGYLAWFDDVPDRHK
jgi:hypothetical protein